MCLKKPYGLVSEVLFCILYLQVPAILPERWRYDPKTRLPMESQWANFQIYQLHIARIGHVPESQVMDDCRGHWWRCVTQLILSELTRKNKKGELEELQEDIDLPDYEIPEDKVNYQFCNILYYHGSYEYLCPESSHLIRFFCEEQYEWKYQQCTIFAIRMCRSRTIIIVVRCGCPKYITRGCNQRIPKL